MIKWPSVPYEEQRQLSGQRNEKNYRMRKKKWSWSNAILIGEMVKCDLATVQNKDSSFLNPNKDSAASIKSIGVCNFPNVTV